MSFVWWLLAQGTLVSLLTDVLKQIPFVRAHPKLTAAFLNALAVAAQEGLLQTVPPGALNFLLALASAFAASVGFYQVKKDVTSGVLR